MPYVNLKITREGATADQKAALMKGITALLVDILNKDPATTMIVIDEVELADWGVAGLPVEAFRSRQADARQSDGGSKVSARS